MPAVVLAVAMAGSPAAHIRVHHASAAERRLVAWAVGRYAKAGLMLPSLDIEFRPLQACGVAWAFFDRAHDRIVDCTASSNAAWVPSAEVKEVLLHELAHAWDWANLLEPTRRRFMAMQGLTTWRGRIEEWRQLGCEQAAEIVAWGLMDEQLGSLTDRLTSIFAMRAEDLPVAFRLLTGRAPLHGPAATDGS
jgi:hypothetical protein